MRKVSGLGDLLLGGLWEACRSEQMERGWGQAGGRERVLEGSKGLDMVRMGWLVWLVWIGWFGLVGFAWLAFVCFGFCFPLGALLGRHGAVDLRAGQEGQQDALRYKEMRRLRAEPRGFGCFASFTGGICRLIATFGYWQPELSVIDDWHSILRVHLSRVKTLLSALR